MFSGKIHSNRLGAKQTLWSQGLEPTHEGGELANVATHAPGQGIGPGGGLAGQAPQVVLWLWMRHRTKNDRFSPGKFFFGGVAAGKFVVSAVFISS